MRLCISFIIAKLIFSRGQTPQYSSAFASSELYQWYGYLALISLSRMHAITGDYYSAVKALDSINVDQKRVHFLSFD